MKGGFPELKHVLSKNLFQSLTSHVRKLLKTILTIEMSLFELKKK